MSRFLVVRSPSLGGGCFAEVLPFLLPGISSVSWPRYAVGHWPCIIVRLMELILKHVAFFMADGTGIEHCASLYCHIHAMLTPSIKPGSYKVLLLLQREGNVESVHSATCECAAG